MYIFYNSTTTNLKNLTCSEVICMVANSPSFLTNNFSFESTYSVAFEKSLIGFISYQATVENSL